MMNKVLILFIFIFSVTTEAEECSSSLKKIMAIPKVKTVECQVMDGLVEDKSVKHVLVIREEGMEGRGVGVGIYKYDDLGKVIYEDYGLGQVLGHFMLDSKKSNLFVRDINNDGINEFGFNVLNERSALFFLYHYDKAEKKFKAVNFKRKVKGEVQTMDRMVASLDYPIEVTSDEIKVWYEKEKFFTYKLKDGIYFSDMDN